MIEANIDSTIWQEYLQKFVMQAVDSVKPSSRYMRDSMDINRFIDIQLIDYQDQSKSQYINGCIFSKNLADKRMPRKFSNPTVLLLKGSLGFLRDEEDQNDSFAANGHKEIYTDINCVTNQEDHCTIVLEEKIKLVNPNIIVTEKDISFKFLEVLRRNNIAAIQNLHLDKMKKLARLTKTFIAPSANVLDKNFQLGKCSEFRAESPPKSSNTIYKNRVSSHFDQKREFFGATGSNTFQDSQFLLSNQSNMLGKAEVNQRKQIIFFEGCSPFLGSTILISGPFIERNQLSNQNKQNPVEEEETKDQISPTSNAKIRQKIDIRGQEFLSGHQKLLKIQYQLRKMIHISRNIILEREILYQLRISPFLSFDTNNNAKYTQNMEKYIHSSKAIDEHSLKFTPFLIKRDVKNRASLVLYKVIIKKGQQTLKNEQNLLKINENNESLNKINLSKGQIGNQAQKRKTSIKQNKNNIFKQSMQVTQQSLNNLNEMSNQQQSLSGNILRNEFKPISIQNYQDKIIFNKEKQSKIDENFVKTKFDSMCGQPKKIKFQFYNINLLMFDTSYKLDKEQIINKEAFFQTNQNQFLDQNNQIHQQVNSIECHHYEKDETLGNFLVRIAQQYEKNKDSIQHNSNMNQRVYLDDRVAAQSQSTNQHGVSTSTIYDGKLNNKSVHNKSEIMVERKYHMLHCMHKSCKDQLYKHVQSFYHKDGHLDIQIQLPQKQKAYDQKIEDQIVQVESKNNQGNGDQAQAKKSKAVKRWHQIYITSQCSMCGYVSNQRQLLSDTFFEYSVSRFFEQYFYNTNVLTSNQEGCKHCAFRDYTRKFHMSDGSVIIFKFVQEEVYNVDLINLKEQRNNIAQIIQQCVQKKEKILNIIKLKQSIFNSQIELTFQLLNIRKDKYFMTQKIYFQNEKDNSVNEKPQNDSLIYYLTELLAGMKVEITKLDKNFQNLANAADYQASEIVSELEKQKQIKLYELHHTPQTMQRLNFLERKFILNYISFEAAIKQYIKVLCMISGLLEFRETVLGEKQVQLSDQQDDKQNDSKSPVDKQKNNFQLKKNVRLDFQPSDSKFQSRFPHLKLKQTSLTPLLLKRKNTLTNTIGAPVDKNVQYDYNNWEISDDPLLVDQDTNNQMLHQFVLKNKPPQISPEKMIEFLELFFGKEKNQEIPTEQPSDQEIKYMYNEGYQQINKCIWNKLKNCFNQIEAKKASLIYAQAQKMNELTGQELKQRALGIQGFKQNDEIQNRSTVSSLFIPLGSDNGLVEVHPDDNGSIIAYSLNSNLYKEALIKNNYLDFQQKAQQLLHESPEIKKNISYEQSFNQKRQVLNLVHKEDIFNYELASQFIETELLTGDQQRLYFALNFTDYNEESSIQIYKHSNNQSSELKHDENSILFNTFKKIDQSNQKSNKIQLENHKSYIKYKDLSLQAQILKNYPISVLETPPDLNSQKAKENKNQEYFQIFESIQTLYNKFYNQIYLKFFQENSTLETENLQQEQIKQLNSQKINAYTYSPDRFVNTTNTNNISNQPKTLRQTSEVQNQQQKQNNSQLNLFGIRKPIQIFFDNPYQQRIMNEETVLAAQYQKLIRYDADIIGDEMWAMNIYEDKLDNGDFNFPLSQKTDSIQQIVINQNLLQQEQAQHSNLYSNLKLPTVQLTKSSYDIKIYYPKKFEALRKFYCGSNLNFIESMMSSFSWRDVTGGKTQSPFQKTFDQKYVMKEVRRQELKMFLEFAPQYFDYICKSFFHNYPCTLAKIVGVYKIQINYFTEKVSNKSAQQLYNETQDEQTNLEFNKAFIDPDDEAEYFQSQKAINQEKTQKIQVKTINKYVFVSENLNYGLNEEDEVHLIRYDLKGSTLNRFVQDSDIKEGEGNDKLLKNVAGASSPIRKHSHQQLNQHDAVILGLIDGSNAFAQNLRMRKQSQAQNKINTSFTKVNPSRVHHDNNFIYEMRARPLPMHYTMNKILNVCVNNDTLCLAKSHIIDYSLLVIINTKTKKLRFGIIDYVQHYTLEKMLETRIRKLWKGKEPTIIEPEKYKNRFKKAIKKYFIAMCVQNEKVDIQNYDNQYNLITNF